MPQPSAFWYRSIPLCDDLWLGMQAQNVAVVDHGFIRPLESDSLAALIERERTPIDLLLPLSALSQMWIFSTYEFLRTWRQRAQTLTNLSKGYFKRDADSRQIFFDAEMSKAEEKNRLVRVGPHFNLAHLRKISDTRFVEEVSTARERIEPLFEIVEGVRVTLAKHEIPKGKGLVAEAPGYGRMSYENGSLYWSIAATDGTERTVSRRDISDDLFEIAASL